jgi:hypothetical protein
MQQEPETADVLEGISNSGEPEKEKPQPTGRKRRGRPKKSDKPAAAGYEVGGEPQPAAKRRPGRPQRKLSADPDEATTMEEVTPDPGDQPQALRRGRSRELAPKGQGDRGRSC